MKHRGMESLRHNMYWYNTHKTLLPGFCVVMGANYKEALIGIDCPVLFYLKYIVQYILISSTLYYFV